MICRSQMDTMNIEVLTREKIYCQVQNTPRLLFSNNVLFFEFWHVWHTNKCYVIFAILNFVIAGPYHNVITTRHFTDGSPTTFSWLTTFRSPTFLIIGRLCSDLYGMKFVSHWEWRLVIEWYIKRKCVAVIMSKGYGFLSLTPAERRINGVNTNVTAWIFLIFGTYIASVDEISKVISQRPRSQHLKKWWFCLFHKFSFLTKLLRQIR